MQLTAEENMKNLLALVLITTFLGTTVLAFPSSHEHGRKQEI
jgi:hypothetical protein